MSYFRFHPVVLILSLGCILSSLFSQRLVGRFDAEEISGDLAFDVNQIPVSRSLGGSDLNFAPSVVFSPDSSRAFVSFPSSNKVAVFNARSGDIIQLVEVRSNPTQLTMTPDGRKVAVPCIFWLENLSELSSDDGAPMGTISIIDVETLEVQNIDLQNTHFSLLNNIVFSPDSSSGFISSSGTDEIIQFNVNNASETDARIAVTGGTRPTSITMSHDGSFFGVVLVGSTLILKTEIPDSIQIVDTQTFQIRKSLSFTADEVSYDYTAGNNVAFSPDGKFAAIGENLGVLSRALLIDVETGELLDNLNLGFGASGGSYATPDGRFFIILTNRSICAIEINSQAMQCTQEPFFEFAPTTRPAFTNTGVMYVASPLNDLLMAFRPATGALFNLLEIGGGVEKIIEDEFTLLLASAPLTVSISPDQQIIATVDFNANSVELFKPSFGFTAPQLMAQNAETIESPDKMEKPEIIPAAERFFTDVTVNNFGDEDTEVIFSAFGEFNDPAVVDSVFVILAHPNPIEVCDGEFGQAILSWDITSLTTDKLQIDEVEIRVDSKNGELFAVGGPIGSLQTDPSITDGMAFFLLDQATGEVLDFVVINFTTSGCSPPIIRASPNPIQICDESFGRTEISWNTDGVTDEAEIRIHSTEGRIFLHGGPTGFQQTGLWVTDGMVFLLLDQTSGEVLDSVEVTFSPGDCLLSQTRILQPNEQISFTANFLQPQPFRNFDGWVDLEADKPTLSGVFLSFDGELNRLDGGSISSDPMRLAVFPEVRIKDGFSTQIEVVNPNYTTASLQFQLFDSSGNLLSSALRSVPDQSRSTFQVAGDPDDPTSYRPLFDGRPPVDYTFAITANPNPIPVCEGERFGQTTLGWDLKRIFTRQIEAEELEIRVNSIDGRLFAVGGRSGEAETGLWVTDGMVFYLLDRSTGDLLDTVTTNFTELGCPYPVIVANPNPIQDCYGTELGQTTLRWDTNLVALEVEVRVNSPDGTVMTTGEALGARSTVAFITDGMTFFLLNRSTGDVLDTVTINLTQSGCPLVNFTDGYIRIFGSDFVAFERFSDAKRMAVLEAQPMNDKTTHFTIPHFVAFAGTDTILKLINPPNVPPIGVFEEGKEVVEEGPIQIVISLRSDDGETISQPVSVELKNGESLRTSVIELFGLQDAGELQSGWIDVRGDVPGLLGSAEIRTFGGEALSAVPLQPVQHSRAVFPHVAQGLGVSTGLAIANPGDQTAQLTLELRQPDSQLVRATEPVTLEPGNRLIGLISDLFPDAGELLGGTVKVLSDQPLTSIELFYSDDGRILSAIPSQKIE